MSPNARTATRSAQVEAEVAALHGTQPRFKEEPRARLARLLHSFQRLGKPVEFDGEEPGIVDREDAEDD